MTAVLTVWAIASTFLFVLMIVIPLREPSVTQSRPIKRAQAKNVVNPASMINQLQPAHLN